MDCMYSEVPRSLYARCIFSLQANDSSVICEETTRVIVFHPLCFGIIPTLCIQSDTYSGKKDIEIYAAIRA